ncbi:MAG: D-2-hydroxyacid dehydrogenase [Clostridia bacterium]|nr:D-2-hydroxyacid dehydrogenase [Clostridia bacterium]
MNITAVDICTVSNGDIDMSGIAKLGNARFYDVLSPEELKTAAADADALLVNKADVTADLVAACPNLKYVGTFSTGFNNLDIQALKKRGVVCCNVPDYSTNAVCQHVFSLLLMFEGNTEKYVRSVSEGEWIKSPHFCYMPWSMREVYGKTFGVYGFGSIGKAVAKVAESFGMKVIVHSRVRPDNCPYEYVSGEDIFKRSDYLSFHCPLNKSTERIINSRTLSIMKPDAVIINTARGGIMDEGQLADALNEGRIRGALLDVLTNEPMREGNPLFGAKNCYIAPHISWGPKETRARLVKIVEQNLQAYINGSPQNLIF